MAISELKPVIPSYRHYKKLNSKKSLSQGNAPEKSLTRGSKSVAGRNNTGKITLRRRGGGHKKKYRIIDFHRNKLGVPARVDSIEYDPNRTCFISLLVYSDGDKRYILTPKGVSVGDTLVSGSDADITPGNSLPLRNIPLGTVIHNIELVPGKGAQLVRSAGASAQLMAKEGRFALLRMPSGEVRKVLIDGMATIGQVSNEEHSNTVIGKAGRKRNMGRRPRVRGIAMTPRDHPHGGGEGASSIGMPSPKSKWGWKTLGVKTRKNKKTDKYIVRDRRKKK